MSLCAFIPSPSPSRRRLDYVNHARRLAENDWVGVESDEEEEDEEEDEEEEMEVERKLPKRYANQVCSCPRQALGAQWLSLPAAYTG